MVYRTAPLRNFMTIQLIRVLIEIYYEPEDVDIPQIFNLSANSLTTIAIVAN